MGFSTTQKAKTTIVSTLAEAGSTLEIEGKVIASSYQGSNPSSLNATSIPIKVAGGGDSVNLDPSITAVKYLSNNITFDDIYVGTLNAAAGGPTFSSLETATGAAAALYPAVITVDPFTDAGWPANSAAFIYWTVQSNTNDILEGGEHAVLAIVFSENNRPAELDTFRAELILAAGASLTVERQVPNITSEVVDLG
jgi:flagellin FlaB